MTSKSNNLLITGGTGSFGQAFLQKSLKSSMFTSIYIYSRDEKKQDDLRKKYNDDRLKFVIGDAEGTPKIALGNASADSMTLTAGSDGFFVDGDGDFRVGDADGERISFDRDAERLVISSSTFMIGSKANGKSFIGNWCKSQY